MRKKKFGENTVRVRVTPETKARIAALADARDVDWSDVVRDALKTQLPIMEAEAGIGLIETKSGSKNDKWQLAPATSDVEPGPIQSPVVVVSTTEPGSGSTHSLNEDPPKPAGKGGPKPRKSSARAAMKKLAERERRDT